MKYIHQHMGLGDHIICNGLIHELQKRYSEKIGLFSKNRNTASVEFMYRDNPNVEVISVNDDNDVINYCNENNIDCIRIGHEYLNIFLSDKNWPKSFYNQMGVDFDKRWSSFSIKRDIPTENKLYNLRNPNNQNYALIHSKSSSGAGSIDYTKIDSDLLQIEVLKETDTIFDYIKLIINAKEIHCIDSSFIHLVDSFELDNKLFYHKTVNYRGWTSEYELKNQWKII